VPDMRATASGGDTDPRGKPEGDLQPSGPDG
jgi:hypothetical protein